MNRLYVSNVSSRVSVFCRPLLLLLLFFMSAGLVLWRPAPASAQPTAPSAEPTEYTATIQRAIEEYGLGHVEEARAMFERAHALYPNARTLRGIALAAFDMRDYFHCVRAARASLAHSTKPLAPSQRAGMHTLIEQAIPFSARVTLDITPSTATVLIDGDAPEREPDNLTVLLTPGAHEVTLEAPGHVALAHTFQATLGQATPLALHLEALAQLTLDLTPRHATLRLNGQPTRLDDLHGQHGQHNQRTVMLPPGDTQLHLEAPGYEPTTQKLTLEPGQRLTLPIHLTRQGARARRTRRILGWTTLGAGLATGGVGLAMGLRSRSVYNDLNSACTGPSATCPAEPLDYPERIDEGKRLQSNATVLSSVAGGVSLLGTVLLLTARAPALDAHDINNTFVLTPTLSPHAAGLSLTLQY